MDVRAPQNMRPKGTGSPFKVHVPDGHLAPELADPFGIRLALTANAFPLAASRSFVLLVERPDHRELTLGVSPLPPTSDILVNTVPFVPLPL